MPTVAVAVAVHLAQAIARAGRSFGLPQGAMFETLLDAFEEELRTERLKLSIRPVPRSVTYRTDPV